jgi:hypothetical protein
MSEPLPEFTYYPDPIGGDSIAESDVECVACGQARGWIYVGPVVSREDFSEQICPWCIADGRAHRELGVTFLDEESVGDYGNWDAVPEDVLQEIVTGTPGFLGWQQERWFTCCDDAAVFLGRAGVAELEAAGPEAIEAIRREIGYSGEQWRDYYEDLDRDGSPTAYLFRCRHCGEYGGYSDFD